MPETNTELAREIKELREEIRQMKELIDLLVALVVEEDDLDDEDMSELLMTKGTDPPRFNN
jgi:hypothetical protein